MSDKLDDMCPTCGATSQVAEGFPARCSMCGALREVPSLPDILEAANKCLCYVDQIDADSRDVMEQLCMVCRGQQQEIKRLKAQNEIMKAQRTEQISENQLLKAENEKLRKLARRIELLLSDIPEGGMTTQEKGILNGAREVLGE